jgi:tetratricopeptide (TPR) repeat protein
MHDLTAAEASLAKSVEVCIVSQYEAVQDISLLLLSTILLRQGELDRAHTTVLEGLALAEKLSDPWAVASGLGTLGEILLKQKKYGEARVNFEHSLKAARVVGDKFIIGGALVNLAILTNLQSQFEESDRYAEEALSIFQAAGDETQQPLPLRIMGYAAVRAGNVVRAQVLMRESLIGNTSLQDLREQLACLIGMAQFFLAEKNAKKAVILCALVDSYRRENNLKFREPDEVALKEVLKQSKKQLGSSRYELAYKQGETTNLQNTLLELMRYS